MVIFSWWTGWTRESKMASLVSGWLAWLAGSVFPAPTWSLFQRMVSGWSDFLPCSWLHQSKGSKRHGWKLTGFS